MKGTQSISYSSQYTSQTMVQILGLALRTRHTETTQSHLLSVFLDRCWPRFLSTFHCLVVDDRWLFLLLVPLPLPVLSPLYAVRQAISHSPVCLVSGRIRSMPYSMRESSSVLIAISKLTADYSYTPEVLPTAHRGTGCGLTLAAGRLASLSSPFIATYADLNTSAPIWVCLALYVTIACIAVILPYEPKNFSEDDQP